jgi:hypothetical protein
MKTIVTAVSCFAAIVASLTLPMTDAATAYSVLVLTSGK